MLIRFSPLAIAEFHNPRAAAARINSPFRAPWNRTLKLLDYELECLAAEDILIRAGFNAGALRVDGWPKGNLSPDHPAVILSFVSGGAPLAFPCDRFITYQDNIRAIALALEALRKVDRFGVTRSQEQYSGFRQIEASRAWTIEDAAEYIGIKAGIDAKILIDDAEAFRRAYRALALDMHPDRGGNVHEWHLLGQARILLDQHHASTAARA
jgi:hypothetical protein